MGRMKGACFGVKSLGFSHGTRCIISSHKESLNVKCRWCYFVGAREREGRSDSYSYSTFIVSNVYVEGYVQRARTAMSSPMGFKIPLSINTLGRLTACMLPLLRRSTVISTSPVRRATSLTMGLIWFLTHLTRHQHVVASSITCIRR